MKKDSRHALALVLEHSQEFPDDNNRWLYLNAHRIPGIGPDWTSVLVCEQGFRPEFLSLENGGYEVAPILKTGERQYDGALVLLGRNRRWNEHQIVRAWNAIPNGARLTVAGNKTDGIGPLRKWWGKQFPETGSFSKFHSVVFWVTKTGNGPVSVPEIELKAEEFTSSQGMFSAGKVDQGSLLLAGILGNRVGGCVADLGAGWGYLSSRVLASPEKVKAIDLFEADYASLEAAKVNLSEIRSTAEISFNWLDVTQEFAKRPYDWVIMNPPFHSGRAAEPDIGKRFIEVAASTLVSGGRLSMVANRNLPYEETLKRVFRRFEVQSEDHGFKVIEAVR